MRILALSLVGAFLAALYFFNIDASGGMVTAHHTALVLVFVWLAAEGAFSLSHRRTARAGDAMRASEAAAASAKVQALTIEAEELRVRATAAESRCAKAADAVSFLGLLQQKGRFLDFVMDDVTKYPDAQVGAAARVVHQGCAAVIQEYFDIKPVHDGQEGGSLTLGGDYDADRYRLLGRITGEPPFRGRILHRGWLTTGVHLPERIAQAKPSGSPSIIAPAEVELA